MSVEKYQPSPAEIRRAEEMMTPEQTKQSEGREKETQLEALSKIVQEHPEVLSASFTPQMLVAFAERLKTESGDVFLTYEKIAAGAAYRPEKKLKLWADKPKLTDDAFVDPGLSSALIESNVMSAQGPGHGGIETLSRDIERALEDLTKKMELINKEATREVELDRFGFDKAQAFLYTFRKRMEEKK